MTYTSDVVLSMAECSGSTNSNPPLMRCSRSPSQADQSTSNHLLCHASGNQSNQPAARVHLPNVGTLRTQISPSAAPVQAFETQSLQAKGQVFSATPCTNIFFFSALVRSTMWPSPSAAARTSLVMPQQRSLLLPMRHSCQLSCCKISPCSYHGTAGY